MSCQSERREYLASRRATRVPSPWCIVYSGKTSVQACMLLAQKRGLCSLRARRTAQLRALVQSSKFDCLWSCKRHSGRATHSRKCSYNFRCLSFDAMCLLFTCVVSVTQCIRFVTCQQILADSKITFFLIDFAHSCECESNTLC